MNGKVWALSILAGAEVAAMTLWFSASAIIPQLKTQFQLTSDATALLTSAVQAGFVTGTLLSAFFNLPDRLTPKHFFTASALVAAIANVCLLWLHPASAAAVAMRFVTGAAMAGVYPVGMKMAAGWNSVNKQGVSDMGWLVGILVGALTLGSAAPHLINAFGGIEWRATILATSLLALAAAGIIQLFRAGPNQAAPAAFAPGAILLPVKSAPLRLANIGYLGHMWELYAMWAWLGLFLLASFSHTMPTEEAAFWAPVATFAAIGLGGLSGALMGGYLADRIGRTALTAGAMLLSAASAVTIGFLFTAPPWLVFAVAFFWGITVIADSAQFSASIAELAPPHLIGTMLTIQVCCGFLLTLVTIHLVPVLVETTGWPLAFAFLALGPLAGAGAMWRLRHRPEAVKLAAGRR